MDVDQIRKDFPILNEKVNGKELVYLDSAATSQKPLCVLETLKNYYSKHNSNVHRGVHYLAEQATEAFEQSRQKVAQFIGSTEKSEVIFTRGATESINMVAYGWGEDNVSEGDEIVVFYSGTSFKPCSLAGAMQKERRHLEVYTSE